MSARVNFNKEISYKTKKITFKDLTLNEQEELLKRDLLFELTSCKGEYFDFDSELKKIKFFEKEIDISLANLIKEFESLIKNKEIVSNFVQNNLHKNLVNEALSSALSEFLKTFSFKVYECEKIQNLHVLMKNVILCSI